MLEEVFRRLEGVNPDFTTNHENRNCVDDQGPIGDVETKHNVVLLEDATNADHPSYHEHDAHGKTSYTCA